MSEENGRVELLLVDGSALLHRAYHAYPNLTGKDGEPINAVYGVAAMLISALEEIKPEYVAVAWDLPKPTFRHEMYIAYKAQRPKTDEDLIAQIPAVKMLIDAFGLSQIEMEGYEADDIIGSMGDKFQRDVDMVVVLTGDQDMMQLVGDKMGVLVPGRVKEPQKLYMEVDVVGKYGIKPEQIVDYKAMIGDSSDNIPGVAGVGPKTAVALLQRYGTLDSIYDSLEGVGAEFGSRVRGLLEQGRDSAILSKELAQIKRDIDLKQKLEEFAFESLATPEAKEFLESVNFRSLVRRLYGEEKKADDKQMGLF